MVLKVAKLQRIPTLIVLIMIIFILKDWKLLAHRHNYCHYHSFNHIKKFTFAS